MKVRYAGFWIRLVADIVDSLILTIASWIVEYALLGVFYLGWMMIEKSRGGGVPPFGEAFDAFRLQVLNIGLYFCVSFPYYVWGHFRWGTTLGKRPFGIYVLRADDHGSITLKQSIGRFFGYGLSYALFFCGFIMAAFHPDKRALHDLLAGTISIRKPERVVADTVSEVLESSNHIT
jgi:uncharacterized RDD family membrane protein YckC